MKNIWKGKVRTDAIKQIQEFRKNKKRLKVPELYNKIKTVEFKAYPHMEAFRVIEKSVLRQRLSAAAKGIYPVLCFMSDFKKNKSRQVSKENIGVYAGLRDWTTVSKALHELIAAGLIEAKKIPGERRYWIYNVHYIRKDDITHAESNDFILFHTCIIDSGVWAKLNPKDQALYLALRADSKFEYDTADYSDVKFKKAFKIREHEFYHGKLKTLSENSGVSIGYIQRSIQKLERVGLVQQIEKGMCCYGVNFKPDIDFEPL